MKIKNIIISTVISAVTLLQSVNIPVFADDSQIFLNESFNGFVSNETPVNLSIKGGGCRVVDDGANNKALLLDKNDMETTVKTWLDKFPKEFVISMDVKVNSGNPDFTLGFSATDADVNDNILVSVKNRQIYTSEGKLLGTVSENRYTRISFVIYNGEMCDAYINGSMQTIKWSMKRASKKGYITIRKPIDENGSMLVDNLRVYSGEDVRMKFAEGAYNSETSDKVFSSNEAGDDTFFDSRYIYTSGAARYLNFSANPKTNSITCARYDYKNPNRETYIYMERSDTSNDCFFDIDLNRRTYTKNVNKKFNYYFVEGDFKVSKTGGKSYIAFRDKSNPSAPVTFYPLEIFPDGSVQFVNGKTVPNVALKDTWFRLTLAVNMSNHTCDGYINGKLEAEGMELPSGFNTFSMFRFNLYDGGKGSIYVDNLKIRGTINPVIDGSYEPVCIYPSDDIVEEFLKDKIGFHAYGDLMYANGVKSKISGEPEFDKEANEYFIPLADFENAYKADISADSEIIKTDKNSIKIFDMVNKPCVKNDITYVPVCELSQKLMGKQVMFFKTGMIIISDKKLNMDTDSWEYFSFRGDTSDISIWNDIDFLNEFLQYEHPDVQTLIGDAKKISEDLTAHPRVYMTGDDFKRQKEQYNINPEFKKLAESIIQKADNALKNDHFAYVYDDAMRMLNTGTAVWENFTLWGYAYNMTGDKKYLDRVVEELKILDTFPDFNTSHIIDTGYFVSGLGIAYDWFYNGFTEEERELAKRLCFDKGLKTLASIHYGEITSSSGGSQGWGSAKGGSNYNGMINGGIFNAAIAAMEIDPEYCADAIKNSIRSTEYILQNIMPGGGWSEGVFYWQYGLKLVMSSIMSLRNTFGTDYGLSKSMGMESTLNFAISAMGTAGANNFHDSTGGNMHSFPIFMTMSKIFNDATAFKIRMDDLNGYTSVDKDDVIFFNFDAQSKTGNSKIDLPNALKTDGVELFSIRDSYDPAKSKFYFSTHFGITSGYHTHNDTGTFVLDMLGERWAEDLGSENYNLQNEKGYKDWDLYRKRAEGHNVIVINPNKDFNQTGGLFIPITKYTSNEYGGYVVTDMDGVYKDASKMKLGYYVDDNMNTLTMRNEFTVSKSSTVYWFMHTTAEAIIDGNTAILSKNGKSIALTFASNAEDAQISVMDAVPLETSPQVPEQNKNEGYRKIAIKLMAKGDTDLTVKISPLGMAVSPLKTTPIDEWQLPQKSEIESADTGVTVLWNGEPVSQMLPVYDGVMPKLEIKPNDPEAIVEVNEAKKYDEKTIIKVWDKTKTFYGVKIISYFKASGKSMAMYNTIPIKSVDVSSEPESANVKANMLDEDYTTRWTCMAKGEWAVFDLGEVKDVAGAAIAFWKGGERMYYFDLYISEDGVDYRQVYAGGTSSGEGEQLEVFDFDSVQKARYIKFVGNGNSLTTVSNVNSNILEFRALENKY